MNSLTKLSDKDLLSSSQNAVTEEKRMTQKVLDHLAEIERRKLYLSEGYPTLFDYCIKVYKYSESSAGRRISAMTIIKTIPEAKSKLDNGSVNLSTLNQLQGFLRKEEKIKTYSQEQKLDLLEKIENKSQDQCQREFVKISPETALLKEKQKPVTENLVQFNFTGSKELKDKLDQLKNLLAHKTRDQSLATLIETLADMVLAKTQKPSTAAVAHKVKSGAVRSRYVPQNLKTVIWSRDKGQCQYKNENTNKICGSQFALEIDHVHPFVLGGSNSEANLRLLCRSHNRWRSKDLMS